MKTALLLLAAAASFAQTSEAIGVLLKSAENWSRGDLDAFMESYENAPTTTFVGKEITRGTQAVLARYRTAYPTRDRMGKLTFSELEPRPLGPDVTLVTGKFSLERKPEAGGPASGRFTVVMRKTTAGWRIIHDHSSSSQ